MKVLHISRRHLVLTSVLLAAAIGTSVVLGGCFQKNTVEETPLCAATDADRVTFLSSYGWETGQNALETLDLVLPTELSQKWADYVAMQTAQGLPFADYGGQAVRRYTYTVTNYEGIPDGVQANLYQCGDRIIGADIIVTGEGGGQYGLTKK